MSSAAASTWRIEVRAGGHSADYPVLVAPRSLDAVGSVLAETVPHVGAWAVISDTTVGALYGERVVRSLEDGGLQARLHTFPAGEASKTRATWGALTDGLLASGLGRDGGVVALGGGVAGDLAGFVAATYMRGLPLVHVPTSVVAMVDSAVGGKTGVDVPAGKNLVGAFHPPSLVLIDPTTISTLPRGLRAQGWAEAVKHGAILDAAYLEALETDLADLLAGAAEATRRAVTRSVEIKAGVVSTDEREAGRREILNFGHTLGHALEVASDFALAHGSAVSVGMVLEARLGESLGVTAPGTASRLAETLSRLELPVERPSQLEPDDVVALTASDKKVRAGRARYVLLSGIGSVAPGEDGAGWARPVEGAVVRGVLERSRGHTVQAH